MIRTVGQLFTQGFDVHVQGAGLADVVISPDPVEDLLPGEGDAGVFHQQGQEFELLVGEFDLPLALAHLHPAGVQPQVRRAEHLWPLLGPAAAAEDGLYPGGELEDAKGLGDVVVGPQIQPPHLVDLGVLGGHQNHRHPGGEAVLPQLL